MSAREYSSCTGSPRALSSHQTFSSRRRACSFRIRLNQVFLSAPPTSCVSRNFPRKRATEQRFPPMLTSIILWAVFFRLAKRYMLIRRLPPPLGRQILVHLSLNDSSIQNFYCEFSFSISSIRVCTFKFLNFPAEGRYFPDQNSDN